MEDNRSNMIRLVSTVDFAANVKAAESYALQEEKQNAKNNYAVLEKRYKQLENAMPYPDRGEFDTGIDLEDIDRIQSEKRANKPWVDEKKQLYKYISKDELYTGHVRMYHTEDYYIMEDTSLESMLLDKNSRCRLINADDKNFQDAVRALANPQKNSAVVFSRAIEMKNREVTNVRIAFDRESKVLSTITDSYLRNALIRNKSKVGLQSIIQTIQEKQDEIRLQKKDASFIVQGCAGSGKTMVLLHRLRYLIFNKAIYPEDYLILVPSTEFKSYIREVSANFGIQQKTIQSYTEYYESVVERKSSCETNENELVFPAEYLSRIYSEKFIQECYREFLTYSLGG